MKESLTTREETKTHFLQHSNLKSHPIAEIKDFSVIHTNCGGYRRRKITEALYIRDEKHDLNKQDQSVTFSLFS